MKRVFDKSGPKLGLITIQKTSRLSLNKYNTLKRVPSLLLFSPFFIAFSWIISRYLIVKVCGNFIDVTSSFNILSNDSTTSRSKSESRIINWNCFVFCYCKENIVTNEWSFFKLLKIQLLISSETKKSGTGYQKHYIGKINP